MLGKNVTGTSRYSCYIVFQKEGKENLLKGGPLLFSVDEKNLIATKRYMEISLAGAASKNYGDSIFNSFHVSSLERAFEAAIHAQMFVPVSQ